jgi:hypothetical protein
MNPVFILSAVAALGIEAGWEPLPDGGHEYTIQIEPQLLDLLRDHQELFSEVPPQVHVRRYRITVGTQKLAQIDGTSPGTPQHERPERTHPDPAENPFTSTAPEPVAADRSQDEPEPEPLTFSQRQPPVVQPPADHANHKANAPGILPAISTGSKPIGNRPAAHHEPDNVDANKPSLPPAAAEPGRPWMPLSIAVVLLCCSLGANVYLGWIWLDARRGHREALSKIRPAGAA